MDATAIVCAIIGSGFFTTILTQIFNYIDKKTDAKKGLTAGLRVVLKDRLRYLCTHYIEQGWIYEDELEDIISMHRCYHDMGGNGYLNELMDRVKHLELRGIGIK